MISVVCVYNNKEILENFLLESLKDQSTEYELILMDNTEGKFKSAAEALNKGGEKAKGKYIMFVHQDIDLKSCEWLEKTENMLNSLDELGIAGVAGRSQWEDNVVTDIEHGNPPKKVSKYTLQNPIKVQTVDECLFIIPRSIFKILKFDEDLCDDWHLYAVDYSLSSLKMGYNVYVIPTDIYHRSPGYSLSEKYEFTLEKLLKKHKKDHKTIFTTMGAWVTLYSLKTQKRWPWLKDKTMIILKKIYA